MHHLTGHGIASLREIALEAYAADNGYRAAGWITGGLPAWIVMWVLAIFIYAGLKWLSFAGVTIENQPSRGRILGYLMLWPGMDARKFCSDAIAIARPGVAEWLTALFKTGLGVVLFVAGSRLVDRHLLLAGWMGMAGLVIILHFGSFHLLSLAWRSAGVDAPPIMRSPMLASSLSDFWSRRWNLAFRDLSHMFVFRPLVGRLGLAGATLAVFLISGLVHDAVISIPARGGWGLPTLYFLIQGLGVLTERSRFGKRMIAVHSSISRLFAAVVLLGPVLLLFHRPFVERVVAPMLQTLASL